MGDIDSYVTNRLDDQIDYFDRAASREQRRGKMWQNTVIVTAAITPLLIGLAEIVGENEIKDFLRASALISSSLAAVATGLLSARRYWENGVLYRAREQTLIREKHLWQQQAGPYAPQDTDGPDGEPDLQRNRLLIESVEAIIAEDISNWTTRMKEASQRIESN